MMFAIILLTTLKVTNTAVNKTEEKSMEFTINRMLRNLFRTVSSDVIKECRFFFGISDVKLLIVKRKMKFLCKYCNSENSLRKLFTDAASLECKMLAMMMSGDICT